MPSAFASEAKRILRQSDPVVIGKHEWRLTLYTIDNAATADETPLIGYEWRRLNCRPIPRRTPAGTYHLPGNVWMRDRDWPRYDSDDGAWAGLPRSLVKLWRNSPWAHTRKLRLIDGKWIDPELREFLPGDTP